MELKCIQSFGFPFRQMLLIVLNGIEIVEPHEENKTADLLIVLNGIEINQDIPTNGTY